MLSGNMALQSLVKQSATRKGMLCSATKLENKTSACMTSSSWSSLKLAKKFEAAGVEFWALLLFLCIPVLKCFVTSLRPPLSTLKSRLHNRQYACDGPCFDFVNHPVNRESASHLSRYFDAGLLFLRGGVAPMVNRRMIPKEIPLFQNLQLTCPSLASINTKTHVSTQVSIVDTIR